MKTVASADHVLVDAEAAIIEAAARALGHPCDARALEGIEPAELRARLPTPVLRERALQAAMIVAMIDGEVSRTEVEALTMFASELGIEEPRIVNLQQLARGHVRRMWIDLARRSFARPVFEDALRKRGLGGVFRIVLPMIGLGADADLARRYNDLGKLPEGSLGRARIGGSPWTTTSDSRGRVSSPKRASGTT